MDDSSFDLFTRRFAKRLTRREVLATSAALTISALVSSGASAKPRCRGESMSCSSDGDCCSGRCGGPSKLGRSVCVPDPDPKCNHFVCGDVCCPADAVGCAAIDTPGGPSVTCQCPRGQEFIDGQCIPIECPTGTNCAGSVRCGKVSNDDFCCTYPLMAYCSCESPNTGEQVAGCCMPGVDCPPDLGWHIYAQNVYAGPCVDDGVVLCCCAGEDCAWAGAASYTCDGA